MICFSRKNITVNQRKVNDSCALKILAIYQFAKFSTVCGPYVNIHTSADRSPLSAYLSHTTSRKINGGHRPTYPCKR